MKEIESRIKNQPKYKIGQGVEVKVETTHAKSGATFTNEVFGFISVIKAGGTSKKDTYSYGITTDMPGCYHSGADPFIYILEDRIKLAE